MLLIRRNRTFDRRTEDLTQKKART